MTGQLYIISAPSGAGKSTLVRLLLKKEPSMRLSISHTTRAPRAGEIHGRDYFFSEEATFTQAIENNEFLEWAKVHGNFYGTSKKWITDELKNGNNVLLEIDWQGATQVRAAFPNAISIFIMPPSFAALRERLTTRNTDAPEVIERRLAAAREEVRHVEEFNYVIINTNLEEAKKELCLIIEASKLSSSSQCAKNASLFAQFL